MVEIKDGKGRGYKAEVDEENRLRVFSVKQERIAEVSEADGETYTVCGQSPVLGGTTVILTIKNTNRTQHFHIREITVQGINLRYSSPAHYYQMGKGLAYSSGGSEITPSNVNLESGNEAQATAYHNDPTMTGTIDEQRRYYPHPPAGTTVGIGHEPYIWKPEDAVILGFNDEYTVQFTGISQGIVAANLIGFWHA